MSLSCFQHTDGLCGLCDNGEKSGRKEKLKIRRTEQKTGSTGLASDAPKQTDPTSKEPGAREASQQVELGAEQAHLVCTA